MVLIGNICRVSGHNGQVFDGNFVYCEFRKLEKIGEESQLKWSDLKFGTIEKKKSFSRNTLYQPAEKRSLLQNGQL